MAPTTWPTSNRSTRPASHWNVWQVSSKSADSTAKRENEGVSHVEMAARIPKIERRERRVDVLEFVAPHGRSGYGLLAC